MIQLDDYRFVYVSKFIHIDEIAKQTGLKVGLISQEAVNLGLNPTHITFEDVKVLGDLLRFIVLPLKCTSLQKYQAFTYINPRQKRAPIVAIMGHINHGKTSLVDYLTKQNNVSKEQGGITQNISIYPMNTNGNKFFLIDTPGHSVFKDIRTPIIDMADIICIIIDANEGVQEQTIEIIKAAEKKTKIICLNKIDRYKGDFHKIYNDLAKLHLISEKYGGTVLTNFISAKTGEGVNDLLDNIMYQSDLMHLKTDHYRPATGFILDFYLIKGRGYVTKVLITSGQLKNKDYFFTNNESNRVVNIFQNNKPMESVGPEEIVEIIGFEKVPEIGSMLYIINDNKLREEFMLLKKHQVTINTTSDIEEKKFIIKGDNISQVQTLKSILQDKGKVLVCEVGELSSSNISLAKMHKVIVVIWGKINNNTIKLLKENDIQYAVGDIIYKILEELDKIFAPLAEIKYEEEGRCEIKKIFHIKPNFIAGCRVTSGIIKLGNTCVLYRKNEEIMRSKIISMKTEKETITEAKKDSECGIIMHNKQVKYEIGDVIVSLKIIN